MFEESKETRWITSGSCLDSWRETSKDLALVKDNLGDVPANMMTPAHWEALEKLRVSCVDVMHKIRMLKNRAEDCGTWPSENKDEE